MKVKPAPADWAGHDSVACCLCVYLIDVPGDC